MATHSSVHAWRIPGTAEPGGLPSMGSHRVRNDRSDLGAAAAAKYSQEKEMATHSSTLAWKTPWMGGAWQATVHGVAKSQTQQSDFTFFLSIVPFGEGNGNPPQCSCLENPKDRGPWWGCILWGCKESDTTRQLTHTQHIVNLQCCVSFRCTAK